jgi:hypothetical protein
MEASVAQSDDLIPNAADCKKIAEVEAAKASEHIRRKATEDAEKKALLDRLSKPSGVSDEERTKRAAAIIQRAVSSNGLTEVEVGRFLNQVCTDHGRAIVSFPNGMPGDIGITLSWN